MIAKHIAMRSGDKSSALRLVRYITDSQDKRHRVAEVFTANCQTEDDAEFAAYEMLAVQGQNVRAKADRTYHLLVSFRPGEEPDAATLRRVEQALCDRLGFGDHQRIAVVHKDTDNLHMHIAVNKIHPTRFTLCEPFMAYRTLATACAELEQSLPLLNDNHEKTGKTQGERAAGDMEAMSGQESLLSWIKRECLPGLKAADSWETLHRELAKAGLFMKQRGNGLVIADASGAMVKASDVERMFSKANLEKRFGVFRNGASLEATAVPAKRYDKKPLGPDSPLHREFIQAKAANEEKRARLDADMDKRYREESTRLRAEDGAARARAKKIHVGRWAKRKLHHAIAAKRSREQSRLHEKMCALRREARTAAPRHTWLSWLQEQAKDGRAEALNLLRKRAFVLLRKAGRGIRGGEESPSTTDCSLSQKDVDAVTKRGTVIYRVGDDALRDDGASIRLAKTASTDTAALALRLARKRFGDVLRIDGDRAFRDMILRASVAEHLPVRFADPSLEQRRTELRNTPFILPAWGMSKKESQLE